ncbi:MAG: polysaccharide deacetylase family protein [Rhizobiaceae bacterium]
MRTGRKLVMGGALALAAVVLALAGLRQVGNARTYQAFGDLVWRVETAAPVIALTFDDGPSPRYTQEVLAILRAHDVPATFFLTGREIEANPDLARAIVAAGHEVGNHSYSHRRMIFTLPATVAREVEDTDAAIRAAGYAGEILFRPPYGKKLLALPWYLSRHGRTSVTWDIEPESHPAMAASPEAMTAHVLDRARPGSIVIMHVMYPSRETSRQALPAIIEGLRAKGFFFATVSGLIAAGQVR